MIVVDTSALIAIIKNEAEEAAFVAAIHDRQPAYISVACVLEATMVASRALSRGAADAVNDFVDALALNPAPVTIEQVRLAQDAFFRFGKGQGSRSQLNFGDCLVYALCKALDAPLLFKGSDFIATDIRHAIAPGAG